MNILFLSVELAIDPKYIVLIVFAGLWLLALLIVGVLALKYQQKHKIFMIERDGYKKDYDEFVKKANIKKLMQPIETNIKLPVDEYFLDISENTNIYKNLIKQIKSKSVLKQARKSEKDDDGYDTESDAIYSLKESYSIGSSKSKYAFPDFKGDLYITNKRIIIKDKKKIEEIKLDDVTSVYPGIIYLDKEYFRGYFIKTKSNTYQVVKEKPETILIIRELIKDHKKEGDDNDLYSEAKW